MGIGTIASGLPVSGKRPVTDLIALSRSILLDPCAAVNSSQFSPQLHLAEEPLEGKLHPLAAGLALLELHGADADVEQLQECYEAGITHCFVSGITEMDHGGSDSDHSCSETVNHSIEVALAGRTIVLDFESTGGMQVMGVTAHKHYPVELDAFLAKSAGALSSPAALHAAWVTKRGRSAPFAYPQDSGWEIGGIKWKLTKIGGLPVDGPEIGDCNVGWDDDCVLSDDYKQRVKPFELFTAEEFAVRQREQDRVPHQESFCFLHYLDEDQARTLGLARPVGTVFQPKKKRDIGYYPEWTADGLDLEATWIVRDELIESYGDSTVLFDSLTVFIGASESADDVESNWRTPIDELNRDQEAAWAAFYADKSDGEGIGEEAADEDAPATSSVVLDPETRLRRLDCLFSFTVRDTDLALPSELTRIVANLERLRRAALGNRAALKGARKPAPRKSAKQMRGKPAPKPPWQRG